MLGLWSTNYAFGGLAAAPFVGWIAYGVFDTWRAAFLAGAAVVVLVLVACFVLQRDRPADVGLPPVDEYRGETVVAAAPEEKPRPPRSVREAFLAAVRDRMVLTLGVAYFLLKPARYAILLWGPVIVIEQIPEAGLLGAVVIPVSFGVAGLAAPLLIGLVSDKLFAARRVPPAVLSLLGLVAVLALFVPLTASGSIPLMVLMLALIGLMVYAADAMIVHRRGRLRHLRARRRVRRVRERMRLRRRDPRRPAAGLPRHRSAVLRLRRRGAGGRLVLAPRWNSRPVAV